MTNLKTKDFDKIDLSVLIKVLQLFIFQSR